MILLRDDAMVLIARWREVFVAVAIGAVGLWLIRLGGWLLLPFGAAVLGFAAGFGLLALRRMRFGQTVAAPGVVEVDEGQVGYFGPTEGGYISLAEMVELRLLALRGQRVWRLKQADGQALLIPAAAQGAERLFDAFASLPGMDTQALVAALAQDAAPGGDRRGLSVVSDGKVIWRRSARVALT